MLKGKVFPEKVHFYYRTPTTKYYYLTESSGYPSAEFQFIYTSRKGTGLVIPEPRVDSANQESSRLYHIPVT
ncbi:hypothetical protein [Desulfolucanica intricata]|uniref:hypothetical protein n=1 Tax=Desulfolucanica intricata TaxID=1285191 RepID=UPI00082C4890|nr:hypothetical protein [Desulfolucanica intricata]